MTQRHALLSLVGLILVMTFQNCGKGFTVSGSGPAIGQLDSALKVETGGLVDGASCSLDGVSISSGAQVTAYQNSTMGTAGRCQSETRFCKNGTLSGSYNYSSCDATTSYRGTAAPYACLFNGRQIPSGGSIRAFQNSRAVGGALCQSEFRSCDDGVLSGSFTYGTCTENVAASDRSCLFAGREIAHGASVTGFSASAVGNGQTCQGYRMTCVDGNLVGSDLFKFPSCNVDTENSCFQDGRVVASGEIVVGFASATVATGQTCSRGYLSCRDGVIIGQTQFPSATCTTATPLACSLNGTSIASGGSVVAYSATTVAAGLTCASVAQTRFCSDGVLSGTFTNPSCSVDSLIVDPTPDPWAGGGFYGKDG